MVHSGDRVLGRLVDLVVVEELQRHSVEVVDIRFVVEVEVDKVVEMHLGVGEHFQVTDRHRVQKLGRV